MVNFVQGFLILEILPLVAALAVNDHKCRRDCKADSPLTCEYEFTVENYFVLSRACYGCPFNYTDCFRPHCISTNGMYRQLMTVNRQLPGPSIEVCKGDTVRVWVHNKIDDGSAATIHWHGLRQVNSNPMDGVPRLTQCNILPFETFKYEFKADNAGTHWWHSHTGVQLGDGIFGPFIVREDSDPSSSLYDRDLSEHLIVINDWPERTQIFRYMEEMQHRWVTPKMVKVLVNGRGRKYNVTDEVNATGYGGAGKSALTPYEVFRVTSGYRYRFRVIAAATRCYFRIMVDKHQLTVITSDGVPIKPATVDSFLIHPGERYDFVLSANQTAGDHWVKVESYGDCLSSNNDGHGAAILHYEGYTGASDYMPTGNVEEFSKSGPILNPDTELVINKEYENVTMISQGTLRYNPSSDVEEDYSNETVHVKYYASLRYQASDNDYYSHPEYYPNPVRWGLITPTINNITMYRPSAPLGTQWQDAEKRFCNKSTLNTETDCNDNLCLCTHMLDVKTGEVVEIFFASAADDPHQMHLHGYTFRVVGEGKLTDPKTKDHMTLSLDTIKQRDELREYPRNLTNPWYKDTVTVQGKGGYVIVRFKADNPGIWFLHCHNEGHLMQGMAMIVKVGDPSEFPRGPTYHPKCGGYSYYEQQEKCHSTVANGSPGILPYFFNFVIIAATVWSLC